MSYAHILGTMYEHSSYYDKGFIIDELMLYHIIYDLYHDPYCQIGQKCLLPNYLGVMIKVIDDMIQDGAFMTGEITDLK